MPVGVPACIAGKVRLGPKRPNGSHSPPFFVVLLSFDVVREVVRVRRPAAPTVRRSSLNISCVVRNSPAPTATLPLMKQLLNGSNSQLQLSIAIFWLGQLIKP